MAIAGAAITLLVLGWYHYSPWLLAWTLALATVSFTRAHFYRRFISCNPATCRLSTWDARHKWTGAVSGGLWGLLALFPIDELPVALSSYPLLGPAIVATAALSS